MQDNANCRSSSAGLGSSALPRASLPAPCGRRPCICLSYSPTRRVRAETRPSICDAAAWHAAVPRIDRRACPLLARGLDRASRREHMEHSAASSALVGSGIRRRGSRPPLLPHRPPSSEARQLAVARRAATRTRPTADGLGWATPQRLAEYSAPSLGRQCARRKRHRRPARHGRQTRRDPSFHNNLMMASRVGKDLGRRTPPLYFCPAIPECTTEHCPRAVSHRKRRRPARSTLCRLATPQRPRPTYRRGRPSMRCRRCSTCTVRNRRAPIPEATEARRCVPWSLPE